LVSNSKEGSLSVNSFFNALLESRNISAKAASSPEQGLEEIPNLLIDIILLDLRMPSHYFGIKHVFFKADTIIFDQQLALWLSRKQNSHITRLGMFANIRR
jgi:CheY-like chemotaxis protein